jgi:hypothetical protein
MWYAWKRREKCTMLWWEITNEGGHSEDRDIYGRMGSEKILGTLVVEVGIGFSWLRIRIGGVPFGHGDELSRTGAI